MAMFAVAFLYIDSMKSSMITAMHAPITSAIHMRVWLNQTWSNVWVFKYIRTNITTVDVAIIAPNRR